MTHPRALGTRHRACRRGFGLIGVTVLVTLLVTLLTSAVVAAAGVHSSTSGTRSAAQVSDPDAQRSHGQALRLVRHGPKKSSTASPTTSPATGTTSSLSEGAAPTAPAASPTGAADAEPLTTAAPGAQPTTAVPGAVTTGQPSTGEQSEPDENTVVTVPEPESPPAAPSPAGGLFPLLPPNGALPSEEECAARVQRDPWEPRPQNAQANATRPRGPAPYGMGTWFTSPADGPAYRGRVTGNFTGTTDEIIQWVSCKWGFPTDLNRAQAVIETNWVQSFIGDAGHSHGLYQMRDNVWAGYPNSAESTAFIADWAMGLRRACYDGVMWYEELRGDMDGCIGVHYSGNPDPATWQVYTDKVRAAERTKPWLAWRSLGGTPPTASRHG